MAKDRPVAKPLMTGGNGYCTHMNSGIREQTQQKGLIPVYMSGGPNSIFLFVALILEVVHSTLNGWWSVLLRKLGNMVNISRL